MGIVREVASDPVGSEDDVVLNLSSSVNGLPLRARPLSTTLPLGSFAFFTSSGTEEVWRVRLGQSTQVDASATVGASGESERRDRARAASSLQPVAESPRSPDGARDQTTAIDWFGGRGYVARPGAEDHGPKVVQFGEQPSTSRATPCARARSQPDRPLASPTGTGRSLLSSPSRCSADRPVPPAPPRAHPALPSMAVLSRREVGAADMAEISALALGDADRVGGSAWLYAVLADGPGRHAEVVSLHLPELQPVQTTRFAVPAPATASHFDAPSGWLYLLCPAQQSKLLRIQMLDGHSSLPEGVEDAVHLPWPRALPLLLPFPEQRQLLLPFSSSPLDVESKTIRLCRIRLGTPLTPVSRPATPLPPRRCPHAAAPTPLPPRRCPSAAPPPPLLLPLTPTRVAAGDGGRGLPRDAGRPRHGGRHLRRRRRREGQRLPRLRIGRCAALAPLPSAPGGEGRRGA